MWIFRCEAMKRPARHPLRPASIAAPIYNLASRTAMPTSHHRQLFMAQAALRRDLIGQFNRSGDGSMLASCSLVRAFAAD
jgi:hypothetical protein